MVTADIQKPLLTFTNYQFCLRKPLLVTMSHDIAVINRNNTLPFIMATKANLTCRQLSVTECNLA